MKFPFYDAPNTATITCCHILENGEPILYVSHDEDDGMWQFLCGKAHETDEAKLVSLKSVFDLDNSVGILKDMLAEYGTFKMANNIAFNKLNAPDLGMIVAGAIISAIGMLVGSLWNKKRHNQKNN
mgnify:CR=1 FL=1